MKGWKATRARFERLLELKIKASQLQGRLAAQLPEECYVCEQGGPEAYERPEEVSCSCPPPASAWLVEAEREASALARTLDSLCTELYEHCRQPGPSQKATAAVRTAETLRTEPEPAEEEIPRGFDECAPLTEEQFRYIQERLRG